MSNKCDKCGVYYKDSNNHSCDIGDIIKYMLEYGNHKYNCSLKSNYSYSDSCDCGWSEIYRKYKK